MKTNDEWVRGLRSHGIEQEDALKELREKLLRGMRAYLADNTGYRSVSSSAKEASQIIEDCAQEALLTIREKLDTFRGESRFTTWATMVAIRVLLGELGRRRWARLAIDSRTVGYNLPDGLLEDLQTGNPEMTLQQTEFWSMLKRIVEKDLTSRQRFVLIASAFQGMPLDMVAETLGSNRDNVYKVLYDARKKLKECFNKRGLTQEEILQIFEVSK
jgi:RNA polymerase sigma-70 factor (ECF subfamily)